MRTFAARERTREPADHAGEGPAPHRAPEPRSGIGNQAMLRHMARRGVRAKLDVGGADDPEEREADRYATQLLSGPAPTPCKCGGSCPKCSGAGSVMRKAEPAAPRRRRTSIDGIGSTGRPLDTSTRMSFETRSGRDLSDVRIHDDPQTERTAGEIGARAFAVDNDIGFARGRYRPEGGEGKELLAHELAHVLLGHGRIRRNGEGDETDKPAAEPAAEFDPCAVDVPSLDNRQLLSQFATAERYIKRLVGEKRKGEEQYYDYAHLLRRLQEERRKRISSGHIWLGADITVVPQSLYRLESYGFGTVLEVYTADAEEAVPSAPVEGAILLTPDQFQSMLDKEKIPTVDPEEYFGQQDPNKPQTPLQINVPLRERALETDFTKSPFINVDPFAQEQDPFTELFGPWGFPAKGLTPSGQSYRYSQFAEPVVTAGNFGFGADAQEGFRTKWRGAMGEAYVIAPETGEFAKVVDLNKFQENFTLYDTYDPASGKIQSIKTMLPTTPGAPADLQTLQTAIREALGSSDLTKRANALSLLQQHVDPSLTQEQVLLNTEFIVNPEVVPTAQQSIENAIRGGQTSYADFLTGLLKQQSITVQMKDKTSKTYTDFNAMHADFKKKLMAEARYRAAVAELGQRARSRIVPGGATAEGHLRPLLTLRQLYDFASAKEFANLPDTPEGRQQARKLQEKLFLRMATPEVLEAQTKGMGPQLSRSAKTGGALGAGTVAILDLPTMVENWDKDPHAVQRYLTNIALSGVSGSGQAVADQALSTYISRSGLALASRSAGSGGSVSIISVTTPAARLAGSTALGGVFAGGFTVGGMMLDEQYFGADYSTIDYTAKGTRAAVSGTVAAGAGALATALAAGGTTAYLAGGTGAAGCTVVLPGVGTVACGTVGAGVGFIVGFGVGLGAYYLTDAYIGEDVEEGVRDAMGEQGCTGR